MSSRSTLPGLEVLEARVTPASPGLLSGLLSLPLAGLLSPPSINAEAGASHAGASGSESIGAQVQLTLPGLSVLGLGLQASHAGTHTGQETSLPQGASLPSLPDLSGIASSLGATTPGATTPGATTPFIVPANVAFSSTPSAVQPLPVSAVFAPAPPLPLSPAFVQGASGYQANSTQVTGPLAQESLALPTAPLALSSPAPLQTPVGGGDEPDYPDVQDADANPVKAGGQRAAFDLQGADLAMRFQPGGANEAAAPLRSFDLSEPHREASDLYLWLLVAAGASALGATWLASRRAEREAVLLASEDFLSGSTPL